MKLKDLILDPNSRSLSLGRCAFWLTLAVSLIRYQDFSVEWALALLTFAGYNQISKLLARGKDSA